jgi:hypothetical protein
MVDRFEFGEAASANSDKGTSCTTDSPNRKLRFHLGGKTVAEVEEWETQAEAIRTPREELRRFDHSTDDNTPIISKNRRNGDDEYANRAKAFRDRVVVMACEWLM